MLIPFLKIVLMPSNFAVKVIFSFLKDGKTKFRRHAAKYEYSPLLHHLKKDFYYNVP
uniref:Uncharacterized protein n=1 Tax=Lepeophtheirus salmonis TaxID=72036 RepID=A0A0K2V5T4_LEPSM